MVAPLCHLNSLTYPREADAGDGPGEYVGHDGGVAVGSREVGVELEQRFHKITHTDTNKEPIYKKNLTEKVLLCDQEDLTNLI